MKWVLIARNLEIVRSGQTIIRGASLALREGSWVGVVGANGSGKTTLVRALSGRLPVSSGEIELHGRHCSKDRLFLAENVGLSPDPQDLPPNLSGDEYLGLISRQTDPVAGLGQLEAALDFRSFSGRAFAEMSAGMKQRISIYAAFVNAHRTIFLDEPFNWLDPVCSFETKKALRSLVHEQGYTLLTPLHDMATLTVYCDRGLLMSSGAIARELETADLRNGAKNFGAFEAHMIESLA